MKLYIDKAISFGSIGTVKRLYSAGFPAIRKPDEECVPFSQTVTKLGVVLDSKLPKSPIFMRLLTNSIESFTALDVSEATAQKI